MTCPSKRKRFRKSRRNVKRLVEEKPVLEDTIFYYDKDTSLMPVASNYSYESLEQTYKKFSSPKPSKICWLSDLTEILIQEQYAFADLENEHFPYIFKRGIYRKGKQCSHDEVWNRWEDIILIDDLHQFFEKIYKGDSNAWPKRLVPFVDLFESKSNFTTLTLNQFYDFISRYFFGFININAALEDANVKSVLVDDLENVALKKIISYFQSCRKVPVLLYKLKWLFSPLIGSRLPLEVISLLESFSTRLIPFPQVASNGFLRQHETFKRRLKESYPRYELKAAFVSSQKLRFVIRFNTEEVHKKMIPPTVSKEENVDASSTEFVTICEAIKSNKLDLLMRDEPGELFLRDEITEANCRRIKLKIAKIKQDQPLAASRKSIPVKPKTKFGEIILKNRKSLSKRFSPFQTSQGNFVLKHSISGVVYKNMRDSILAGCFDEILIATDASNVFGDSVAIQEAVANRQLYVYNNQYRLIDWKLLRSKYALPKINVPGNGKHLEHKKFEGVKFVLVPLEEGSRLELLVRMLNNKLNSYKIINKTLDLGLSSSEVCLFEDIILSKELDEFFLRYGSAPFKCKTEWFTLVSQRLRDVKHTLAKRGLGWHLLKHSSGKRSSVQLMAAYLCYSIGEYVSTEDNLDIGAYILHDRILNLCISFQAKVDTNERKSYAEKNVVPSFDKIMDAEKIGKTILFEDNLVSRIVKSFNDRKIGEEVVRLAFLLKLGKLRRLHTVVFTGAGIGTGKGASLPTVRGAGSVPASATSFDPLILENARPTMSHMIIKALVDAKYIKFVCTQNIENLHKTSGLKAEQLWEVHGNIFDFECSNCGTMFDEYREVPFDMLCPFCSKGRKDGFAQASEKKIGGISNSKYTRHSGSLRRKVIRHYGENVKPPSKAKEAISKMRCCIVVGSSLRVGKIAHFVCPPVSSTRPLLGIVNIGETKKRPDNWARSKGVLVNHSCDEVFKGVALLLGLKFETNPPKCERKIIKERGETILDLKRIFFGERNVQI